MTFIVKFLFWIFVISFFVVPIYLLYCTYDRMTIEKQNDKQVKWNYYIEKALEKENE